MAIALTVCMKDGSTKRVKLRDMDAFIKKYKNSIQTERSSLPEGGIELW